ncbi:MAG: hypothetical protein SFU99_18975 [Saprospiraceae bacterium]|nr:hypothetical protein [Saprospiraceae bacterium]
MFTNLSMILLLIAGVTSYNLEKDLSSITRVDFSKLNSNDEYQVYEGFARLVPTQKAIVLYLEGKNDQGDKTFRLQTKSSSLYKEKILGKGKAYFRGDLLYFDGNEQFNLYLSDVTPPIKLKNSYTGFGLAAFNKFIDFKNLHPEDATCECIDNSESGSDCDAGGPGSSGCSVGTGIECSCFINNCTSGTFACCKHCKP